MAVKLDTDLYSIQEARGLVLQAKAAQAEYTKFDQNKVDRVVENMARAGAEAAAELAKMALEETGFGVYEHKVFKNIYNSRFMWQAIKDLKTVGVIGFDPEQKIIQIAQPMGVIAALVPVTHPTATVYFNSLIALKTGNAIVFSPHPRAPRSAAAAAQLMEKAARAAGAPPHLISCMENISLAGTNELMQQRDVALILGTGGAAMVQAVYHSGKPAITAGPGNVPVYVDRSCKDIAGVVRKIILSKTFDNGTPCASEQSIIADAPIARRLKTELRNQGAYFLSEKEKQALGSVVLRPDGSFAPEVVGQSPQKLAKLAGFSVPMSCRLLVAELDGVGKEEPLSAEILSTVIGFYTEENWQQGLKRCNQLLEYGGLGHTCSIHTEAEEVTAGFAAGAKVFRLVVNCPSLFGAMGSVTGIQPSFMLGTGTWGGSITSDNISPRHLMHIKRVAYGIKEMSTLAEEV